MNKKKSRLYNKEITTYYIHWASKFATMIIKHKQIADYIHWASKFATSANIGNKAAYHIHWLSKLATSSNKRRSKTNPELKPL